ncbi:Protein SGT1-like protein [Hibiscus syriacus]|uniref:Protein SGT1-like protein n=1 Tax=Hibiscus syriacus TaxID=106335 RepID=A0A6A2YIK6_HIBSY|nr:Protein SGT1-like protein [Hibiscus syriacus]
MKLEEYQTGKATLESGPALALGESRFSKLIKECEERIVEETGKLPKEMLKGVTTNVVPAEQVEPVKDVPVPMTTNDVPVKEVKHLFYQKPEEVVVTIFAKGIPRDCVKVDYGEQIAKDMLSFFGALQLSVSIKVPGKDAYHFQPRLFGKIIPNRCRYDVFSTKIEIRLTKAEHIHWASLEFSREVAVPQREKDEKLDGDAALNKFFRDIYQDADEDTRRAMQKSFVESNGTVFSTNWKEVGVKVEGSPPDGMEMKKWEY